MKLRIADPAYPQAPPPLPDSSLDAGFGIGQPAPAGRDDVRLASEIINGGWLSPAPSLARLLLRVVEVGGEPEQPLSVTISAMNAVTKVFESVEKTRVLRKTDGDLADRIRSALEDASDD